VNSINFARVVAQCVYYFTAAVALGAPQRPVTFVVPSGNFGDAFAGYMALKLGLPIARIVVATNSNDILARTFQTGRYVRGITQPTSSPAMDIQSASNFERLYFEAARRDGTETARAFQAFAENGAIDIPPKAFEAMAETFTGLAIGEDEVARTILSTFNETGELIDPHTAVAVAAAHRLRADLPGALVALSTAHPAKFPEAVEAAARVTPIMPPAAEPLAARAERFDHLPADAEAVKAYVRDFAEGV
jgi:threonine synthase